VLKANSCACVSMLVDEYDTEPQPCRSPGGRLNPEVRGDATNNQCRPPGFFEHDFKIGSRKCTPMAFGDDEVARLHSGGRNQFRSHCGRRILGITVRAIGGNLQHVSGCVLRQQQQGSRQSFIARIEQLVYQVLLNASVLEIMCATSRSEKSCSPLSMRIISSFSIESSVMPATAVAVAIELDSPARHQDLPNRQGLESQLSLLCQSN